MRLLPAALLAALLLAGCANAAPPPRPASTTASGTTAVGAPAASAPAASAPAASAPFYLGGYPEGGNPATPAVEVINGFTGQVEATIAAPHGVGSLSWDPGRPVWGPCGAAPDDRTFLLCGASQYWELRLGDDGKPQSMTGPADIPVAARNSGSNGGPDFAVSADRRLAADSTGTGIMVLSLVTGATRTWTIPPGDGSASSLSWAGDRYVAFEFDSQSGDSDAGGVRVLDTSSAATSALTASRLIISSDGTPTNGRSEAFNPVITPDGATIVAALWTGFIVAELAEFSAQTGRLLAVLVPQVHMPGSGTPCQVLWTDLSGAHLIAYCGTGGVVNGTRFTPVNLHVPNTSGIGYGTAVVW
jgi:hypothetical protein